LLDLVTFLSEVKVKPEHTVPDPMPELLDISRPQDSGGVVITSTKTKSKSP